MSSRVYRQKFEGSFENTSIKQAEFHMIHDARLVCLRVKYQSISKTLEVSSGKERVEVKGKLESKNDGGFLPFQFHDT